MANQRAGAELLRQNAEKIALRHQADARGEGFAHHADARRLRAVREQLLQLLVIAASRRRHRPAVAQQLGEGARRLRRVADAAEDGEALFKQLLEGQLVIVGPAIVGIDGEVQLPLPQFADHRDQLPLHNPDLDLRMLLAKAGDRRRHQGVGDARAHADAYLPGVAPEPLLDLVLRGAQLFQNQAGVLKKALPALGQRYALAAADKKLRPQPLLQLFNRFR